MDDSTMKNILETISKAVDEHDAIWMDSIEALLNQCETIEQAREKFYQVKKSLTKEGEVNEMP